jgi:hypothetical protein
VIFHFVGRIDDDRYTTAIEFADFQRGMIAHRGKGYFARSGIVDKSYY